MAYCETHDFRMETFRKFEQFLADVRDKHPDRVPALVERAPTKCIEIIIREYFTKTKKTDPDAIRAELDHELSIRRWYVSHHSDEFEALMALMESTDAIPC